MENNTRRVYGTDTLMIELSEKAQRCMNEFSDSLELIEYETEDGLRYDYGDMSERAECMTAADVIYDLENIYDEWKQEEYERSQF